MSETLETSETKAEQLDLLLEVQTKLPFKDPKSLTRDFIEMDEEGSELFTTILDIEPDINIDAFFEELYTAEMIYGHVLCAKTDDSGFYYQVLLSAKQLKAFASMIADQYYQKSLSPNFDNKSSVSRQR